MKKGREKERKKKERSGAGETDADRAEAAAEGREREREREKERERERESVWVVLFLLGTPIMVSVTVLLLRRMPVKSTPMLVKLDVGMAWLAALTILLLVPLDMSDTFYAYNNHGSYYNPNSTSDGNNISSSIGMKVQEETLGDTVPLPYLDLIRAIDHKDTVMHKVLGVCWELVYWYAFAAMMVILPFHQEYADSGAFTVWEKIKWSLRQNLLFLLFAGSIGCFGVLVLLASHRLTFDSLIGFAIAASNAFGLCLVLLLLGYGLVELPRKIWRMATAGSQQIEAEIYHSIGLQAERTKKAHKDVCRSISIVREVTKYFGPRDPLRKYMEIVESAVDLEIEAEVFSTNESYPGTGGATGCMYDFKLDNEDLEFEYADEHQLGLLRRDVRNTQETYGREQSRYLTLIKRAFLQVYKVHVPSSNRHSAYQLDEDNSPMLNGHDVSSNQLANFQGKFKLYKNMLLSNYNRYMAPTVMRICSLCLYFLSVCIVLSQLTIYEGLPLWIKRISPLKFFIGLMEPNLTLIQITCLGLLGYILGTCWFSMFKLKVFSIYIMVPEHTPPSCMLMNAMLLCRLTAPIAFNFMIIAMPPTQDSLVDVRQTTFYEELGERMLDLSSLGNFLGMASLSFTTFAPFIMLPYMIIVLFNKTALFTKCCSKRNKFQFEDYDTHGTLHDTDENLPDTIGTAEDALGQKLVEEEYDNFMGNGLRLGIALRNFFAEVNANQNRSLLGRLLARKSPAKTPKTKPTSSSRRYRNKRAQGGEDESAIQKWFKKFNVTKPGSSSEQRDAVYEPLRLSSTLPAAQDIGGTSNHNTTGSSTSKPKASEELDSIFKTLR